MPTYEYACPKCGLVEAFQSIKEDALTKCPKCKKQKVTRMVSTGGGVIFKGSGFWETDYNRSKEYATKAKSDTATPADHTTQVPADAKTTTTAEPKTDSKKADAPATKAPEPKPQAQAQAKKVEAPAPPSPKSKS